jgi:hypothetical protein
MPLEDLDLVFEDEEELKKKSDTLQDDVVLEFGTGIFEKPAALQTPQAVPSAPVQAAAPAGAQTPKAAPSAATKLSNPDVSQPNVKRLEEVRAKMAQNKGAPVKPGAAPTGPAPVTNGSSALQLSPDQDPNLAQLVDLIETTKFEARVEVAVAQQMSTYMAEMLSDAKLMQHQVQQLLMRLNQKNAANKPELVAIQKALADFINKKRKYPHEK